MNMKFIDYFSTLNIFFLYLFNKKNNIRNFNVLDLE